MLPSPTYPLLVQCSKSPSAPAPRPHRAQNDLIGKTRKIYLEFVIVGILDFRESVPEETMSGAPSNQEQVAPHLQYSELCSQRMALLHPSAEDRIAGLRATVQRRLGAPHSPRVLPARTHPRRNQRCEVLGTGLQYVFNLIACNRDEAVVLIKTIPCGITGSPRSSEATGGGHRIQTGPRPAIHHQKHSRRISCVAIGWSAGPEP